MIEMTGEYDFHAPQELIWDMMLDPEVLSRTMPGCETLERVDDNTFQGRLNIRVGPVQGVFQGKVETVELRPPAGFRLIVNGSGPAGVVRGEGNLTFNTGAIEIVGVDIDGNGVPDDQGICATSNFGGSVVPALALEANPEIAPDNEADPVTDPPHLSVRGAVAPSSRRRPRCSGRSAVVRTDARERTTARCTRFSSSRTLPG